MCTKPDMCHMKQKASFQRDKGGKKKNIFKEISFSLLIYEFHEKGVIFFSF